MAKQSRTAAKTARRPAGRPTRARAQDRPDPALVEDLVTANHILFRLGVVDAFGHPSVRDPARPDRFLLARNMAPGSVTAADIMTFDLGGNALGGDERAPYLERFIHGEIYRARPDVMAVVHSHSPAVIPFAAAKKLRLRPIFHMAGFLGAGVPVFEIRCVAGDASDLLIRNCELGAALAKDLGAGSVVLMRGHGSTAVGASIQQAVYRAVYTEVNARLQSEAMRLDEVEFLTEGEAASAAATNQGQLPRAWNFWKQQVAPALPPARSRGR
jgi:ribulose-5-phosphate 4-epimerase/fuculose-1-phosphate aldolase